MLCNSFNIILAKRLSEKERDEISNSFTLGETVDDLAKKYNCTKLTISRNLKKTIGEKVYKELITLNKKSKYPIKTKDEITPIENMSKFDVGKNNPTFEREQNLNQTLDDDQFPITSFTEIAPLNLEIDNSLQKDLSSIPISEVKLPNTVYMILDKQIELETKYLKDYPNWQFLSQDELSRKTIEIYFDLKIAKRFCRKEQKIIKVPNTNVFNIVAPILLSRGISRIVSPDQLIAL